MWKLIIFSTIVGLAIGQKATFINYKVFRITPTSEAQIGILRRLEQVPNGFSFWQSPSYVDQQVDLMVAPDKLPDFSKIMKRTGISYDLLIEDVQALVDQTTMPTSQSTSFNFTSYHTIEKIYNHLDQLAKKYPDKVQVIVGGKSYEGRELKGVKVSFKTNNPGVFIEGGIHAREWISPATTMYILEQLLTSKDPEVRALAERHDWYIFPSFNPDGYVYTYTTNRLWRKSRKPYGYCYGTDLNRNWDYRWMTGGASDNPCDETYAGSAPFSDVETYSMSRYIASISDKFYAYISFHSYSQFLIFPYGHTEKHLENYNELYAIGTKAITALKKRYGTKYVTGNTAETIYVATGSSVDYIKGTYHKPIAYTYELRDRGANGFILPPEQIIPTGEEIMDSLIAMFKEIAARGYPKNV